MESLEKRITMNSSEIRKKKKRAYTIRAFYSR